MVEMVKYRKDTGLDKKSVQKKGKPYPITKLFLTYQSNCFNLNFFGFNCHLISFETSHLGLN